ncbi:hypothetical protein FJ872_32545 [Mesorhizobium sp. B2-5-9]|uniref:hypothetical protein n=1 Tax=Mesorhizobium sp. B2-5-9 TaxID=2589921 RepID=UPI00112BA8D7|nr:hypothetical protein [Mesorhizobium sp. B2-5-9]TPJ96588.1 hypothetical protein FJ872_32545 [Mesorhizobium sp. B2-5-9]
MILAVKIAVFVGVLFNFIGSIMLLRDFRDMVQLPFFRWRTKHLKGQLDKNIRKRGVNYSSLLYRAMQRHGVSQTFSLWRIIRAPKDLRQLMRLNNEHDSFRRSLGLQPYLIVDTHNLNASSVDYSFREIEQHLNEWEKQPDPEESTDRTRAIKLFVWGFALLLLAAFLDLLAYAFGIS